LFFVPQFTATIISEADLVCILCFFFVCFLFERARAASKQEQKTNKEEAQDTILCFFFVCYLESTSLHSIRILFTSNPIHELRLDLNVANTVIALTIRVIYLSLIITLKRGVVVLWFTVTCPLSSGFLLTILPAEQFLSPKTTKSFPHTHQAPVFKNKEPPSIDTYTLET